MAQILYWDDWQIRRNEQIRIKALYLFPWSQLEKIKQDFIDPFTNYWSATRKIMLLELVYRIVYEAYVAGMIERKKAGKTRYPVIFKPAGQAGRKNKGSTAGIRIESTSCPYFQLILSKAAPLDIMIRNREKICQQLIDQLVQEFSVFRWLDEWNVESVIILLQELSRTWFQKGWAEYN
ncbi:hypothetical protein [Thermoactinomyces mirandus]|uniref:Uncharacterized protein n=1 Tax=Thermoactinomyces mirandus TaxID=2756294 RepID=A0A7W1XU29_9BACL|nr:hypothetical protein [Thermoactinomyces mirandus]MBA4603208.1 hypothetical protein [Thermoactinomyces mirandus]